MPEHIRTAISLRRDLFERGEALAGKMNVSRSRLFALALEDYIGRRENRRLLERINSAYEQPPDSSERALQDRMRRHHRRLLRGKG